MLKNRVISIFTDVFYTSRDGVLSVLNLQNFWLPDTPYDVLAKKIRNLNRKLYRVNVRDIDELTEQLSKYLEFYEVYAHVAPTCSEKINNALAK